MSNNITPIRVLVADDFQLLREDLNETISAQPDMEVVGMAENGQKTVQLAKEMDFDIVIIDIEMESMNAGIKAAEKILEFKPDARILFLTAHETDETVVTAMATGAMDYIVKGGPDEELLTHIRSVYRGEPMLDARIQRVIMQEYGRLHRSEQSLLNFIQLVSRLTPAERALIRFLLDGYKIREIAQIRCVEIVTVKTQIKGLLRKFDCSRSKEIIDMIRELGLEKIF